MPYVEEFAHRFSFLFAQHKKNRAFSSLSQLLILLVAILSHTMSFAIGSVYKEYKDKHKGDSKYDLL
jgi:hypothetical protein